MGLKLLDELNREFQTEIMEADSTRNNRESESAGKGIKSLEELNREFQMDRMMEIMGTETLKPKNQQKPSREMIKPIVIKVEPPEFSASPEVPGVEMNLTKIFTEQQIKNNGKINRAKNIKSVNEIKESNNINNADDTDNIKKTKNKKQRSIMTIISDILFYSAILTIMISILTSGSKDGKPRMFMGYSYFTVLTSSMQDEIPKGSFIIVHETDPQKLKIGDAVTYMRDDDTTVTHKIISVYDNYENSGARGFQTKGVNNADPDKDIVYAANIVGKVIFHIPVLGAAVSYLKSNIYIVFVIFGLCIILSFLIRMLFTKSAKSERKRIPVKI
ncbi:MAG: signal peptidase I [Oscillospiraceae bacterium]|nr:signal peptidase I [Oscillospiraceae bacterium]